MNGGQESDIDNLWKSDKIRKMKDVLKKISETVDAQSEELFQFTQNLVRIPSLPGKEQPAQALVAKKLEALNLKVDRLRSDYDELKNHPAYGDDGLASKDRINIIGRWKGVHSRGPAPSTARSLILNGHIDVVPPGNDAFWEDSPWSGAIKNGKLYGRGSCDMKAGLASALFAIQALQSVGFGPVQDLLFESVIGEESGGIGTLTTLVKGYEADAAIVLEPTRLNICPVQAGALAFRIKIAGRSAHACLKKSGESAIEKFCFLFEALNELEKRRHREQSNALYDDPHQIAPLNIGTIRGGSWHSTVPDEVVIEGRFGVFPSESIEKAKSALAQTLDQTAEKDPWLKNHPPSLEWIEGQFEPACADLGAPIIQTLSDCFQAVAGHRAKLEGVTYGSDLQLFINYGKIPAVLFGPGDIAQAHSVDEYVSLGDVILCTKVLASTILCWCGGVSADIHPAAR